MFERFTDRARRVIILAQEEALLLNHRYIGSEHILLGLIHEGDGVAAQVITSFDVILQDIRTEIEEIIGTGGSVPYGHIPFTPRAKKVLELSLREALQLGHDYIGTEHILLALIREGEGVACQVLVKNGLDLSVVRQKVVTMLSSSSYESRAETTPDFSNNPTVTVTKIEATPQTPPIELKKSKTNQDGSTWYRVKLPEALDANSAESLEDILAAFVLRANQGLDFNLIASDQEYSGRQLSFIEQLFNYARHIEP